MRKIIKFVLVANFILTLIFLIVNLFLGSENLNPLYPHIDTGFSKDFSYKNWWLIKSKMSKEEVIKLIGEPLQNFSTPIAGSPPNSALAMLYSEDGAWCCSDFAWEMYVVYLDKDMKVIHAYSGWRYD